jgi:hypothetical protein
MKSVLDSRRKILEIDILDASKTVLISELSMSLKGAAAAP